MPLHETTIAAVGRCSDVSSSTSSSPALLSHCTFVTCDLLFHLSCHFSRTLQAVATMATTDPLSSLEGDMLDVAPGVERVNGEFKTTSNIERLPSVAENGSAESKSEATNGETQDCDVLVVGAGFSG